ncbi:MAG: AhpC/TSA family protein [Chloroflexota bacterium]|nr:AhpC/TSA family protein [Chloroflexota bacterium]
MTTATPIADQVDELQAATPPSAVAQAFATARQVKNDAGLGALAELGSVFPDGDLLTGTGEPTTFAQAADGRPAVVIFYRGAWCPYCNVALRTYNAELAGPLAVRGVALVAISPQRPDGSKAMKDKNELVFTVLSDPGNQIGQALGIVNVATVQELVTNEKIGFDLTRVNADGTSDIIFPTAAVVDGGGVLRFLDVHVDYTTRTEPASILAAVDQLHS